MEVDFLEELLQEAEQKEVEQTEAFMDLLLLQIKQMKEKMEYNFNLSENEIEIIREFYLRKNTVLDERIKFIERKLESFIRERGEKTISLPNGDLKYHMKPAKVEVTDMALFLQKAHKSLFERIPEQVRPSLLKIKAWLKTKPIPAGVTVTTGKQEFSYKLNNRKEDEDGRKETSGATGESAEKLNLAV